MRGVIQKDCTLLALFSRPPASEKRRKVEGLNSRYDRMIETASVIQARDMEHDRKKRKRNSSTSGSSSLASWDTPKTPLDTTGNLDEQTRPELLSKSQNRSRSDKETRRRSQYSYQHLPHPAEIENITLDEVPGWLSDTVATLQVNHPLRDLIPASTTHTHSQTIDDDIDGPIHPSTCVTRPGLIEPAVEDVFAFRPPTAAESGSTHAYHNQDRVQIDSLPKYPAFPASTTLGPLPHASDIDIALRLGSPSSPRPTGSNTDLTPLRPINKVAPLSRVSGIEGQSDLHSQYPDGIIRDLDYDESSDSQPDVPFSRPGPLASSRTRSSIPTSYHLSQAPITMSSDCYDTPRHVEKHSVLLDPALKPLSPSNLLQDGTFRPSADSSPSHISFSSPRVMGQSVPHTFIAPDSYHSFDGSSVEDTSPAKYDLDLSSPVLPDAFCGNMLSAAAQASPIVSHTPGYSARVYFDSPAEDPVCSDPLEPTDYELNPDYEGLHFRWTKFDRSGTSSYQRGPLTASSERIEGVRSDESNTFLTSCPPRVSPVNTLPSSRPVNSPSPLCNNVPRQHRIDQTPVNDEHRQLTPAGPRLSPAKPETALQDSANRTPVIGPAFAPAPGIYISPLRGEPQCMSGQDAREGDDTPSDGQNEEVSAYISLAFTPL